MNGELTGELRVDNEAVPRGSEYSEPLVYTFAPLISSTVAARCGGCTFLDGESAQIIGSMFKVPTLSVAVRLGIGGRGRSDVAAAAPAVAVRTFGPRD